MPSMVVSDEDRHSCGPMRGDRNWSMERAVRCVDGASEIVIQGARSVGGEPSPLAMGRFFPAHDMGWGTNTPGIDCR